MDLTYIAFLERIYATKKGNQKWLAGKQLRKIRNEMKTSIVFSEGTKQIIFTPENDDERQALKMITPDDNIELAIHSGTFGDRQNKPFTATINKCRGGYLRLYSDQESVMLVLTPKEKDNKNDNPLAI